MATVREVLYQNSKNISIRNIAKAFKISRTTISKYLQLAIGYGYHPQINDEELQEIAIKVEKSLYANLIKPRGEVTNKLILHQEIIKNWLDQPNMTHTQIQRLLALEGVIVGERSINRFIKNQFPKLPKYTVHLLTEPGREAQVDFGYVGMMKDSFGKLRKTYAFVMTLSHSRYRYVEFVFAQDQVTWAGVHINAFNFFGGVPLCVLLDNLKAGVIKVDIYDPTLNETYSELSRFYGFAIDPAKAYTPEHKGKVERTVRIVKEQLIAGKKYSDINEANIEAVKWCRSDISHRICSSIGKRPIDIFNQEEKDRLLLLPSGFFDTPEWSLAKVHRDHHFVVKGNFYSVPTRYIGQEISVRIGLKTVCAYYEHTIIKTHPRNHGKGQWITDQKDYPESALHYLESTNDRCLELAKAIGVQTHKMIKLVLKSGTKVGNRKAQAILRLAKKYGNNRLEAACLRGNNYTNNDYKSLCNILANELDKLTSNNFCIDKPKNTEENSYVRASGEYISAMRVNYVQ